MSLSHVHMYLTITSLIGYSFISLQSFQIGSLPSLYTQRLFDHSKTNNYNLYFALMFINWLQAPIDSFFLPQNFLLPLNFLYIFSPHYCVDRLAILEIHSPACVMMEIQVQYDQDLDSCSDYSSVV
jgi:hypothetical protein